MEEMEGKWERLRLTEEEDRVFAADDSIPNALEDRGDRSLVGRVTTERSVGKWVLESTMAKVWRISQPASFREVRPNVFVITFASQTDKWKVWEGKPWLFDNCLIVLNLYDGFTQPAEISFAIERFWVQLHDLPLACMNEECGKEIGGVIGRVVEVDTKVDGCGWGQYLRIRVEVDLLKALVRGRRISVKGKCCWIPFKYEKLPRICFDCGRITHFGSRCENRDEETMKKQRGDDQFGPWLRADPPGKRFAGQKSRTGSKGSTRGQVPVQDCTGVEKEPAPNKVSNEFYSEEGRSMEDGEELRMEKGEGMGGVSKIESEEVEDSGSGGFQHLVPSQMEDSPSLSGFMKGSEGVGEGDLVETVIYSEEATHLEQSGKGGGKWKRRARDKGVSQDPLLVLVNLKRGREDWKEGEVKGDRGKKGRKGTEVDGIKDIMAVAVEQPCQTP